MDCKRCGAKTPRLTLGQRYCPTCTRELTEARPAPSDRWAAPWIRRLQAKDFTNRGFG